MSGLYQRTSQSLQGLTDVVITNIQNGQAPVYDATSKVYKNQTVLTPSSLPSGSSGDVIISDGAGGIFSTTGLNVNPSNGHITGTFLNVEDTIVKIANNAGAGAGGDTISIGWNSGTNAGNDAVSIGTNAGQGAGNNSISLGKNAQATYNNSIVINSLGTTTTAQEENACYINPLRNVNNIATLTTQYVVQYNDTTKELIKTEDLYTRHIKNTDLQNDGTLTNVGTATLYNGQLTVGVTANKIINGSNTLVVDFATNKVGVNQLTPAEELDVNGNVKFNGTIEVSNGVGSAGQVLSSNAGSPATWINVPPPTFVFGSFDILGGNFNLITNNYTTITALKQQTGVTATGMSVNSSTGIITLDTAGLYLLNASFTIGQQGGGGGLNEAYLYVTDSANSAIKLIATYSDNAVSGDFWRTITLSGHAVIPAPTSPYQIMFRALGSTNGSLTSIRDGVNSSGASILKIA